MNALIVFKSKSLLTEQPTIFTTGGHEFILANGKSILIDWNLVGTDFHVKDGCMYFESMNRDMDEEYSSKGINIDSFRDVVKIEEIYYECNKGSDKSEDDIELAVVSFTLYSNGKEYSIPEAIIKSYNEATNAIRQS